ncbi:ribosome maturation factor RimP [Jeotgalibaca ciconiae]|uniref:Ribosome maturation factor RimP n=1 Tax=Jeotgalibaca ciconiae TaxID=2496265 RepID=A0A3Q9BLT9_9LACT|nr:ribosome maturation factor RimP [Jeotgalibaca ciconiae]AZP05433.1 ribosome maturation factor RimP [Jeotgalibaca ciconiae]HJB24066.1 ribosome maturation factor RimP [Candidatus Jeotgalibaca pullicola]
MSRVVDVVKEAVLPVVEERNFELVDVEFLKEGKSWFLRIYIDKPGGIDIEECAWVSERVSDILDAMDPDPIPQAYFLEVSSPGAERPLKTDKDLQNAIGSYVHLSYYQAIEGEKFHEGTLLAVTEDFVQLEIKVKTRTKTVEIPRDKIAKARLAIQF